jgi:hypothetical protein
VLYSSNYLKPPINKEEKPEKASTKSDFDLQEKCSKASKDYFEKNKRLNYSFEDYSNHYNKRQNKCFILVQGGELSEAMTMRDKYLTDVFENKDIADWSHIIPKGKKGSEVEATCKFLDGDMRSCSESEFDSFVKPYMEE